MRVLLPIKFPTHGLLASPISQNLSHMICKPSSSDNIIRLSEIAFIAGQMNTCTYVRKIMFMFFDMQTFKPIHACMHTMYAFTHTHIQTHTHTHTHIAGHGRRR
jgi:hypothetical protein